MAVALITNTPYKLLGLKLGQATYSHHCTVAVFCGNAGSMGKMSGGKCLGEMCGEALQLGTGLDTRQPWLPCCWSDFISQQDLLFPWTGRSLF